MESRGPGDSDPRHNVRRGGLSDPSPQDRRSKRFGRALPVHARMVPFRAEVESTNVARLSEYPGKASTADRRSGSQVTERVRRLRAYR